MSKPFVFGIGLSRTGTSSLDEALRVLGWKAQHFPRGEEIDRAYYSGGTDWPCLNNGVEAVTDLPAAIFFRELHEKYPEAKFVLTTRALSSWLRSMEQLMAKQEKRLPKSSWQIFFRAAAYRTLKYNGETLTNAWKAHHRAVKASFAGLPNKLLVLPCEQDDADKWDSLCGFLDVPVPMTPYPRKSMHFNG